MTFFPSSRHKERARTGGPRCARGRDRTEVTRIPDAAVASPPLKTRRRRPREEGVRGNWTEMERRRKQRPRPPPLLPLSASVFLYRRATSTRTPLALAHSRRLDWELQSAFPSAFSVFLAPPRQSIVARGPPGPLRQRPRVRHLRNQQRKIEERLGGLGASSEISHGPRRSPVGSG